MASDNRVIDLTLRTNTSRFAQRSFSSVLVASVSNLLPENVFSVNQLLDLPEDTEGTDIYKAVQMAFAQDRPLGYINVGKIVPSVSTLVVGEGTPSLKIDGELITANTPALLVTALETKLGEGFTVELEEDEVTITITDTNRKGFFMSSLSNISASFDVTGDFTNDLEKMKRNSDFFGFALADHKTDTNIVLTAQFAEESKRQFFVSRGDANIKEVGSSDILSQLKALSYDYTNFMFSEYDYADVAFMSQGYSVAVGSDNFANMTLSGIKASDLTENEYQRITAKNGNTFETIHNVSLTQNGISVSGEHIDVIRDACNLYDDIQTELMATITNTKIHFTNDGIMTITEALAKVLDAYVANGFIAEEEITSDGNTNKSYTIQAPRAENISQNDKAQGILRNVNFQCRLAGAINRIVLVGSLSYANLYNGSVAVSAYLRSA